MMWRLSMLGMAAAAMLLVGCDEQGGGAAGRGGAGAGAAGGGAQGGAAAGGTGQGAGGGAAGGGGAAPCPADVTCVDSFPFTDTRDTSSQGSSALDGYGCAPGIDESGPEIVYRLTLPGPGFVSAAVYEQGAADIDVHILTDLDSAACLDRGNLQARADVSGTTAWVVADTYAGGGSPAAGAFRIDIGFIAPSVGPCDMQIGTMARVGDGGNHLPMPATGPIVREAHLVTDQEPPPYPSTPTEELAEHYALSQSVTALVMFRSEVWAPLEGGSFYGAGIGSPADLPTLHEGWYVNMYWTAQARPPKGTRMILRDPNGGSRAVVVAAGYETGPGNLSHIGGTPEETHFFMGTSHLDDMKLGIAVDQTLPFGPRVCQ